MVLARKCCCYCCAPYRSFCTQASKSLINLTAATNPYLLLQHPSEARERSGSRARRKGFGMGKRLDAVGLFYEALLQDNTHCLLLNRHIFYKVLPSEALFRTRG